MILSSIKMYDAFFFFACPLCNAFGWKHICHLLTDFDFDGFDTIFYYDRIIKMLVMLKHMRLH